MLKAIFLFLFSATILLSNGKMYLDENEMNLSEGKIRIHLGENNWIFSNGIFKDERGIFTFESNIDKGIMREKSYERTWKCPYCFHHWPIGERCQNAGCPSKY